MPLWEPRNNPKPTSANRLASGSMLAVRHWQASVSCGHLASNVSLLSDLRVTVRPCKLGRAPACSLDGSGKREGRDCAQFLGLSTPPIAITREGSSETMSSKERLWNGS